MFIAKDTTCLQVPILPRSIDWEEFSLFINTAFLKRTSDGYFKKTTEQRKSFQKKSIIQFVQISVILIELSWEYKCTLKIWWLKNLINYPHNIVKFLRQEKLGLNFSALL